MKNKNKIRMMAGLMVMIMLAMASVPLFESEETDATSYDNNPTTYYRYVITYSGQTISSVKSYSSASDTAGTTMTALTSWGFNSSGYGPFNSFYAAINNTTGTVAYHLNPNDLTKTMSGNALNNTGQYNIMWVIPTVYWSATPTTLTLTNDPSAGTAYAHTIDGVVHNYLGIGVYEGYKDTDGKLKSMSGKIPTGNTNRATFRTAVEKNGTTETDGNWMLWNYFQYNLVTMAGIAAIGSWDAQSVIGNGNVSNTWDGNQNNATQTAAKASLSGNGDKVGFYGANNTTGNSAYSKLYVENLWGSMWIFVDDIAVHNYRVYAGQNGSGVNWCDSAYSQTWETRTVMSGDHTLPNSNNWWSGIYTDDMGWGLRQNTGTGACDYYWTNSGDRLLVVGGAWFRGSPAGLSAFSVDDGLSSSGAAVSARPAYVFDADAASGGNYASLAHNQLTGTLGATPINTLSTHVYASGSTMTLPDYGYISATKSGTTYVYRHTGWTETANCNTAVYAPGCQMAAAVKILYSTWAPAIRIIDPNNVGTITHSNSIGTTSDGYSYLKSGITTWPTAGTTSWTISVNGSNVPAYTHSGYNTVNSTTFYKVGSAVPTLTTQPLNVYSTWSQETITVTFYGGAPTNLFVMATLSIPINTTPMLFTPNLGDGIFDNWYTDSNLTNAFDPTSILMSDTSLYCGAMEFLKFTSSPVADATITYLASLDSILFDATSSTSAYKVQWDFGDGYTSTDKLSYHTYDSPGVYGVTLKVTNYTGEVDSKQYTVTITDGAPQEKDDNTLLIAGILAATVIAGLVVIRPF